MTFTKREGRLFVAMCVFDVAKSISLFVVVSQLAADSGEFWRSQQPDQMGIKRSLSDLLLMATMRVSFLCGIYVSEGDLQRKVALSVAYISFRILTLVGSIYLAMKLAFFEYSALGSSAAVVCAVLMIAGSLVALWVESVVPYVLTAARLADDDDDSQALLTAADRKAAATLGEKGGKGAPEFSIEDPKTALAG